MKLPIRSRPLRYATYGAVLCSLVTCIYWGITFLEKLCGYDGSYYEMAFAFLVGYPVILIEDHFRNRHVVEVVENIPLLIFLISAVLNTAIGALLGFVIGLAIQVINKMRLLFR